MNGGKIRELIETQISIFTHSQGKENSSCFMLLTFFALSTILRQL